MTSVVPASLRGAPGSAAAPVCPGELCFGMPDARFLPAGWVPIPVQRLAAPARPSASPWLHWQVAQDHSHGEVRCRDGGELMFGQISWQDPVLSRAPRDADLDVRVEQAYTAIFHAMDAAGCAHLVRCWNFLPRITDDASGGQRYFLFNTGRRRAFDRAGTPFLRSGPPAACAVGTSEGSAQILFLASRKAPQMLENPRQTSAFHYPREYGPDSPQFSRAALQPHGAGVALLVSGTASIVGHRSTHADLLEAQLRETLLNLRTLVDHANARLAQARFALPAMAKVVYLRAAGDLPLVADLLQAQFPDQPPPQFLRADICRRDLLVEIEAHGYAATGGP